MATFSGEVEVDLPQAEVWAFIKNVDNWAHLFPGHQRHLEVETDHFFWQLRGEAGVWSRLVEFDVHVTEWLEPDCVRFAIKGRTEPVVGSGMCFTKPAPASKRASLVGFQLDANATGATAPMVNMLLKRFVSEQSGPFLEALSATMVSIGRDRKQASSSTVAGKRGAEPDEAGGIMETPRGPGSVIVRYRAPRTTDCEKWLREHYSMALWHDQSLIDHRRLERVALGPVGDYQEILDTRDLAATVRHLNQLLAQIGPDAYSRGVMFEERPYLARRVSRLRRSLARRLLWRMRRPG